jgi:hypothetical protein
VRAACAGTGLVGAIQHRRKYASETILLSRQALGQNGVLPVRLRSLASLNAMWPLRRKRHLRYASLEAWFEGEGLNTPIVKITDPVERDRRITEYGELRQHLFQKHIDTLSDDEQRQFTEGTHPSQSHLFAKRAEPFAAALAAYLAALGLPAKVSLGWYHLDRIVLAAELEVDPGARRSELPWLFRGFEIKYLWPLS